ncbi:MAG: response regulator [Chloroflexota bacterium]
MDKKAFSPGRERVLIVDDAREIREFLREYILEPTGFEVISASDGLEGLQLAFSEKPDLVIVDFQMPHMNGLELLRRLQLRMIHIPSILITAHGSEQVAVEAFRLGVRDYVIKPFDTEEMKKAIDRALRESRLAQEREQLIKQLKRNNKQLKQHAQELNALYSIGKSVSSSLNLETILQRTVVAAGYLSGADQASLMLLDERGDLYLRATKGGDQEARTLNERIQDQAAERVLQKQRTAVLGGDNIPLHVPTASRTKALAYLPLATQGNAIGVLAVANHKRESSFTRRETRALSALASYAASAIANARLHERIAAERNQLHTIINQSDNPILVLNKRQRIVVANRAARDILSLPAGALDGKPLNELVTNRELLDFITQLPDTGLVRNTSVRLSTGRTYRATLTPIRNIGRSVVMQLTERP